MKKTKRQKIKEIKEYIYIYIYIYIYDNKNLRVKVALVCVASVREWIECAKSKVSLKRWVH